MKFSKRNALALTLMTGVLATSTTTLADDDHAIDRCSIHISVANKLVADLGSLALATQPNF